MIGKRRIARTQESLNDEWAKYDRERKMLTDEQKKFEKSRDEFNARVKDEEKALKKRVKTCEDKEKKVDEAQRRFEMKKESFEKTKQRIMRESKRVEKTKKELDSQKAEIDATQKKHEKQMKKLQRTKEECERAQNAFLLKVQPWQKKLVKIRKLKENVRKETLDARLQYENEFEEKLAKWVNQWELKNEELQQREASLQKSTSSLLDREEDLKSWSSELETFQEKLNEKQEYIISCRIDEREEDLKQKLDDLVKEEKRFQERQEKLGEWEKTQIAKMKEYEEKMIDLVEREAKVDQIKKDCLQKDAIRDKQMKELEEREAKFLEVVNTFTAERGKFEGERKEFHRWRRKEKRKIEDESKASKKKMKKVETDLVELESRKEKWLESAKKEVRIDQQRMELEFLKKMKRREAQSDTKMKLREKQMEAEMKRSVKKARQELQRSSGVNTVRLNEIEDLIMEKEAELQKLHALVEAKRFELEDVEKDVERLEAIDVDKIKTQVEQKLLEKQEDWELEREIERAEYEANIKHKERSLREELQIEMYANMDEERMNMEDEIRNGIAEKLRIQTESLDEYLSEDNFSWMENQMQLLARKIKLQQVHTQLWLDQERSKLEKQRKDLESYAAKTKLTMCNSVDTLAEKEQRLLKREKKLKEQKEELQELKRELDRAKKDLILMKGSSGKLAPNGVEQAYSVKTYTGGGRKNRSMVRASKSSTRKKRRNSIESSRSASVGGSRRGRSPGRRTYRKPDVLETCPICKEQHMTSDMRDHMVTHATKIKSNLYLGNCKNAHDIEGLKKVGITHILNCAREIQPKGEDQEFVYKQLDLVDKSHQDILHVMDEALKFMFDATKKGGKLFVHCQQGVSRSASFCCAFFMKRDGITLDAALAILCCKRHIVQPNSGFLRQLREFEVEIKKNKRK